MITVALVAHPVFVVHRLSGLDAKQNVVGFPVLLSYIMNVIGAYKRYPRFFAHFYKSGVHRFLFGYAVVLKLKEKVSLSEYIQVSERHILSHIIGARQKHPRHGPGKAGAGGDEPFMVFSQKLLIHPRLIIKAFRVAEGNQLDKVLVSFVVFGQKDKVIVAHALPAVFFKPASRSHINLAAYYRFYARFIAGFIKVHNSEHSSVIRYGKAFHAKLGGSFNKVLYFCRTVQEAVFRMNVQMRKICFSVFHIPTSRINRIIITQILFIW